MQGLGMTAAAGLRREQGLGHCQHKQIRSGQYPDRQTGSLQKRPLLKETLKDLHGIFDRAVLSVLTMATLE